MSEIETRRVPADWSFAALHAAGAESVTEIREGGALIELEVRPSVSDGAYASALAAFDLAKTAAAWTALRQERDRRLAASDWTQMLDVPLSEAARLAWGAYRQDLRDLPEAASNPAAVVWPAAPVSQEPLP